MIIVEIEEQKIILNVQGLSLFSIHDMIEERFPGLSFKVRVPRADCYSMDELFEKIESLE